MSTLILDNSRTSAFSRRQLVALILAIALLAFYVTVWRAHDPRGADFSAFYSGAIVWERGQPVYDQKFICEIQARLGGKNCMPFFHPPVLLPLVSLVSSLDYVQSYRHWVIVLLVMLAICAIPAYQITRDSAATLAAVAFIANLFNFLHGQDSFFVLLGLLVCGLLLKRGIDAYAGIALSLTVLRPTLAIALAIPLLFVNRKAFLSFFVSGLVLTLYSLMLVGPEGFRDLFHSLMSSAQTDPTTRPDRMYSVVGALVWWRLDPGFAWIAFAVSIPVITWLWKGRGLTFQTFALAIVISTFASPHLHLHDVSFLILPLLLLPSFMVPLMSIAFAICIRFEVEQLLIYVVTFGLLADLGASRLAERVNASSAALR